MAVLDIAQLGDPVLRVAARPLTRGELRSAEIAALISDMIETMRAASGAGLAAPQVSQSLQICVIELGDNPRYPGLQPIPLITLINPVITPLAGSGQAELLADREAMLVYEGCLSVRGLRGRVRRPRKVRVEALGARGEALDFVWEGFRAAVVQHEVDHLRGTLFVDRALPGTLLTLAEYERLVPAEQRVIDGAESSSG